MSLLKKIFVGPNVTLKNPKSAIDVQLDHLKNIWENKTSTIGIERIFRFFLILIHFVFPNLYVRNLSGKKGTVSRKLCVELYVLFKLLSPLFILLFGLEKYTIICLIIIYLSIETITYLLGIVFLSDIYTKPISFKRSLILIFINFVEITLNFAVLYKGFNAIKLSDDVLSPIYFSFVSGTTVGFGDITPISSMGQILVIFQSMIFLLFIVVFFSHFISNLSSNFLANKNPKVRSL